MGKVFFNIGKATPDVIVSSDGLRDPLRIRTTQALGGFGALPPYFLLRDRTGCGRPMRTKSGRNDNRRNDKIRHAVAAKRSTDGILNWFTFPLEPLVSISGKNEIIRRLLPKAKERERSRSDGARATTKFRSKAYLSPRKTNIRKRASSSCVICSILPVTSTWSMIFCCCSVLRVWP